MSARREFSKPVKAEILRRANASGRIVCEGCGLVLGAKRWHVDHTIPDALAIDKTRPLTAADGKLLGVECCHAPKTVVDVGVIAKSKRAEAKFFGIPRKRSTFPGGRNSPWKMKIGGRAERRT